MKNAQKIRKKNQKCVYNPDVSLDWWSEWQCSESCFCQTQQNITTFLFYSQKKNITKFPEKSPKLLENHNETLKKLPVKISPRPSVNANTPRAHRYIKKLPASHKCNKSAKCTSGRECSVASQEFGTRRHDDTVVTIQRDLVGRTPMEVQGVRVKKVIRDNTGSIKLAHKIVQKAMAAVHKIINKNERNSTNVTKLFKVVQKRSMSLRDDQSSHQADYMSPHMYKKPSPRKLRKKISLNNIKVPNNLNRKRRMRRDILYQGNAHKPVHNFFILYWRHFTVAEPRSSFRCCCMVQLDPDKYQYLIENQHKVEGFVLSVSWVVGGSLRSSFSSLSFLASLFQKFPP